MPTVELVYDRGCPNVGRARAHLVAAFVRAKMVPRWHEHACNDASIPDHARGVLKPLDADASRRLRARLLQKLNR